MYVCMYICMYVCVYVCMYVCMYVCTYVCMYVCMYVCTYVCMYVCMYVRTYIHMYECAYVYVCTFYGITVPATVSNLANTATDDNCIIRDQDNMLTCTYDGAPQPSVLWYTLTDDTRVNIPASDADYVVTITPTETILTIRDVDSEDAGTYGCEATNTVNGSVMVNHMEIDVIICSKQIIRSSYVIVNRT